MFLDEAATQTSWRQDLHQAVKALVDHLGIAVAIYDRMGRLVHQTPVLVAMLEAEANRALVMAEAAEAARPLSMPMALASTGEGEISSSISAPVIRQLRLGAVRYQVRAVPADRALSGQYPGELGVLVVIERDPPVSPSAEGLRERFGFTRAQGNVALLLLEGVLPAGISARLGISRHTVSRHLEAVFSKLGVHSRGEAVVVMRGVGWGCEWG